MSDDVYEYPVGSTYRNYGYPAEMRVTRSTTAYGGLVRVIWGELAEPEETERG